MFFFVWSRSEIEEILGILPVQSALLSGHSIVALPIIDSKFNSNPKRRGHTEWILPDLALALCTKSNLVGVIYFSEKDFFFSRISNSQFLAVNASS